MTTTLLDTPTTEDERILLWRLSASSAPATTTGSP